MANHEPDSEIGRVLGGRYRIVAPIGVGASARVFLADDITLRRRVAVKVLHSALAADDAFLRRFRAEAQSAASLNHQHVLGVYDWGHDDVPYLVTEYLGGGSLQSMLSVVGKLSPSQGLLVGLEAARGLEYAHGEGLVHRDIKPANLLFDDAGRLRIADFGLARALAEAGWTEPDGSMVGTARYAAPEQARGERVGPPADVYALALLINETVSGELPFAADTAIGTLMARADSPLEPHSDLGPLAATVRRAGALDPDERPTAAEFVRGFMDAAEDLPRPEPLPLVGALIEGEDGDHTKLVTTRALGGDIAEPAAVPADDDEDGGRRWPWLVLAVLALIGAGVGGFFAFQNSQAETDPVPDLVGGTAEDAVAAAQEFGWVLNLDEARQDGSVEGEILEVDPEAGTELEDGDMLRVVVSLGENLVIVPNLAGETVDAASALLEAEGLELGDITEQDDETVEAGIVLNAVLDPGQTEVEPGSSVDVAVSRGPVERQVPGVPESGDVEEARALIVERRLMAEVEEEFSDDVPVGEIIAFTPSPQASVPADSTVTIVVSKGPAPRAVPNVIGLTVEEATAELEEDGFEVAGVTGSPSLPVRFTDPEAGEVHPVGTRVRILTELVDDN